MLGWTAIFLPSDWTCELSSIQVKVVFKTINLEEDNNTGLLLYSFYSQSIEADSGLRKHIHACNIYAYYMCLNGSILMLYYEKLSDTDK